MTQRIIKAVGCSAAATALVLSSASPALAAKKHHRSHKGRTTHSVHKASSTTGTTTAKTSETALTGATLSSASAAALTAVPGGTVTKATTETDSSNTSAAYEVHITKSDGSKVLVVEDSSFTVLSTAADAGCAGHGGGGDPGRNGGPPH